MKEKVIVTGGAGFIGSHLVPALLAEGYDVEVIDDLSAGKREHVPAGATLTILDVRDTEKLREAMAGVRVVFHLAAFPQVQYSIEHPLEANDVNVNGTLSALQAARGAGVKRFVLASSAAVYGDKEAPELVEDMPAEPKSPYGLHKQISELYCRLWSTLYGMETVCPRFFNVYGPGAPVTGAYALVTAIFLKQKLDGKPLTITGDGQQTRDFVHVRDIARALIAAATSEKVGHGEIINIGSGVETSIKSVAEIYGGEAVHIEPRIEPRRSRAGIARARELLGWEPTVAIMDGIAELKRLNGLA